MHISLRLRRWISLHSLVHDYSRRDNLIIHHGLMGSSKNFRTISKNSAVSDHVNSHLIDARNHGQSPHDPDCTVESMADDLMEYIQVRRLHSAGHDGPRKLLLMGHSLGGLVLMQFTKKYWQPQIQSAIERVILIDIPCSPLSGRMSFMKTGNMLRNVASIDLKLPIAEIKKQIDGFATSPDVAGLLKMDLVMDDNGLRWYNNLEAIVHNYPKIGAFDLQFANQRKWVNSIEVIYGSKSDYVTQLEISKYKENYPQMSDANFHKVEGAGHWVHFDKTKDFLLLMNQILKEATK